MGKASFFEIKDSHGKIQAYINRDEICPGEDKKMYNDVFKKHLDIEILLELTARYLLQKLGKQALE